MGCRIHENGPIQFMLVDNGSKQIESVLKQPRQVLKYMDRLGGGTPRPLSWVGEWLQLDRALDSLPEFVASGGRSA